MIIYYDYYCKLKERLINYIQYKEIINKLKTNKVSNQYLVDCSLVSNIFKAKDFRRYITSKHEIEPIVDKLIFLKFDSYDTAWENSRKDIVIFTYRDSKTRWKHFYNFINIKQNGTNKSKRRTLGTKTRKYSRRSMETRRKMH